MSTEPSAAPAAAPATQVELASVLMALKQQAPATSPLLLAFMAFQTLIIGAVLALLIYQHLHPAGAPAPATVVDPLVAVKSAATAYRKDEAAAFRRVKATITRSGDAAKDKAALATAIHDQRIAKAQALADSLTASADWPAALEAAAAAFDATEKK